MVRKLPDVRRGAPRSASARGRPPGVRPADSNATLVESTALHTQPCFGNAHRARTPTAPTNLAPRSAQMGRKLAIRQGDVALICRRHHEPVRRRPERSGRVVAIAGLAQYGRDSDSGRALHNAYRFKRRMPRGVEVYARYRELLSL